MTAITIDESHWPVVLVRFVGSATDQEFDDYLRGLTDLFQRPGTTTVTILDSTLSSIAPSSHRQKQAEWLRKHQDQLRERSAGTAFVISSAMQRAVLSAVLWMQPLAQPHVVVATQAAALHWAREQLRKRGIEVAA